MTDKLDDVWATRDYPVLVEIARRIDAGAPVVRPQEVRDATGLDDEQLQQAFKALRRRGFIAVETVHNGVVIWGHTLSGEAYLMTGLHPSGDDALSSLVAALRQAADLEPDPVEKGRIKAAADGLLGISRNIATGVLTAWLTHHVPGAGG